MKLKVGNVIKAKKVGTVNDLGGTTLCEGEFSIKVTRFFRDYETGIVIHGHLINKDEIEEVRSEATTGFPPENTDFDPSVVYTTEWDLLR